MKLPAKIKEWLPIALITALSGGIGTLLTSIYKDAVGPFVAHALPAIKNQTLLLLCLLLCLICGLLIAWLAYVIFGDDQYRFQKRYTFLPDRGLAICKRTRQFVCGACFVKGISSPLVKGFSASQDRKKAWVCLNAPCDMEYPRKIPEED